MARSHMDNWEGMEHKLIELLAAGLSDAEIAKALGCSVNAVIGKRNRLGFKRENASMVRAAQKAQESMASLPLKPEPSILIHKSDMEKAAAEATDPRRCLSPGCKNSRVTLYLCNICDQRRLKFLRRS